MKISILDRVLLLITCLLAAYQIGFVIDGFSTLPMIAYTIAFGVLLVSGLLIILLGIEVLESPVVIIVATMIPLTLSLGLVWQHLESFKVSYLVFAIIVAPYSGAIFAIVARSARLIAVRPGP